MTLTSAPLWQWDTSGAVPIVETYSSGKNTKTGLQPDDLQNFIGIPLQYYGNPPRQISPNIILGWIRSAEDWVEQHTGLLLCQSYVASPPAVTPQQCSAINITPQGPGGFQQLGYDFDISDAAYDFIYQRARDEGWMEYSLRYKPLRSVTYTPDSPNAIKQISYVYPLLNEYFRVPQEWIIEDHDFGLLRLVPSANVQMLPLFAMQLAFMGFAESVPGGIWMQFTAGLTQNDYNSRFSFMLQLVLAQAAILALSAIQGGINLGIESQTIMVDGLQYKTSYNKAGAFAGLITQWMEIRKELVDTAKTYTAGPVLTML